MLLKALRQPDCYDHPVSTIELLETHISWILLTGDYAYKIKKPVDLGFVDFTTLARRRHYCYEELRLNRRLAADLYCDVVTINGNVEQPVINGSGEVLEYAVRMRQFDQQNLLVQLASRGQLHAQHCDALADIVADFHHNIEIADADSAWGSPDRVARWAQQNFEQIEPLLQNDAQRRQIRVLKDWTGRARQRLCESFAQRKQQGFIRECHGDLHLGNIALIDGHVTVFDCIEFNEELRWIDVMSEVAFLVMDLCDHRYTHLANRFLDRYLMHTGDYQGLAVLPFYLIYRALVRAKIDLLRLDQSSLEWQQVQNVLREYQSYIDLALDFAQPTRPTLFITHGLAGSGKSTLAAQLVEALGVIRIRSDVERKRLAGLRAQEHSGSELMQGIYTQESTQQTYRRVAECAGQALAAGYPVIADATFLQRWQRELFEQLAQRLGVKWRILAVQAPVAVLRERIEQRQRAHRDPSEADVAVLEAQLETLQPLSEEEIAQTVIIDSSTDRYEDIVEKIRTCDC
jgi:aminoglycoside phosphotransferase family enzyme/predicted kinase